MRLYFSKSAEKRAMEKVVETREDGLVTYKFETLGIKGTYVPTLIQGLTLDEALALNAELGGGCHIDGHLYEWNE